MSKEKGKKVMSDSNLLTHDQVIAKVQHFSDSLKQRKLEKESLHMTMEDKSIKLAIHNEILIYAEILKDYNEEFQQIIREDT